MRIYNYKYIYIYKPYYIYIYLPIYKKMLKPHHVKTLLTTADESEVAHCFTGKQSGSLLPTILEKSVNNPEASSPKSGKNP